MAKKKRLGMYSLPEYKTQFRHFDLRGRDHHDVDFSGADFTQSNLSDANFQRADLREVILSGADLTRADLTSADLGEANLRGANLSGAKLIDANLGGADLREANLTGADFGGANFNGANLSGLDLRGMGLKGFSFSGARLSGANLCGEDLSGTDFSGADLSSAVLQGADLRHATMVDANLMDANLTGCRIFGISAWRLKLNETTRQQNLVITDVNEPELTADNIEVAQFLYLMLHNKNIRSVIDTITSKVVLILGRFTPERKVVLDALRDELRKPSRGYVPVVFDFDKPRSQSTVETVSLLARMARFVIADLSDAKSVLQELQAIVPTSPKLAVQPLILTGQQDPGMFDFFKSFPWVLPTYHYDSLEKLAGELDQRVIRPTEAKVLELRPVETLPSQKLP